MSDTTTTEKTETTAAPAETTQETQQQEPSLAELLSEFDTKEPDSTPAEKPKGDEVSERLGRVESYLEGQAAKEAAAATRDNISDAVKTVAETVKGGKGKESVIEGLLHKKAFEDDGFRKAFEQQEKNPLAWKAVLKAIAPEIEAQLGPAPDPSVTADADAVEAAMRGASTATPSAPKEPNFSTMSNAEYRKWAKENLGYTPMV